MPSAAHYRPTLDYVVRDVYHDTDDQRRHFEVSLEVYHDTDDSTSAMRRHVKIWKRIDDQREKAGSNSLKSEGSLSIT